MYKIKLSNEIENRHLEYYEKKIVPNFDNNLVSFNKLTLKEVDRVFGTQIARNKEATIELLQEKQLDFMSFCKKEYKDLAIGKPEALRKIMENIKENH